MIKLLCTLKHFIDIWQECSWCQGCVFFNPMKIHPNLSKWEDFGKSQFTYGQSRFLTCCQFPKTPSALSMFPLFPASKSQADMSCIFPTDWQHVVPYGVWCLQEQKHLPASALLVCWELLDGTKSNIILSQIQVVQNLSPHQGMLKV